jgi:hypothetical protein
MKTQTPSTPKAAGRPLILSERLREDYGNKPKRAATSHSDHCRQRHEDDAERRRRPPDPVAGHGVMESSRVLTP